MHWRLLSVWLIVFSNISLLVTKQIHATLDEHSLEAFNPENCSSKRRNGERIWPPSEFLKVFILLTEEAKGLKDLKLSSWIVHWISLYSYCTSQTQTNSFSISLSLWLRPEGSTLMYIISNYLQYFRLLLKAKQTNESPKSSFSCSHYTRWKV